MSTKRNDQEALRAIRDRARELQRASDREQEMADPELLAAWHDGTLSFDDIPEEVLARLVKLVGRASAANMLKPVHELAPSVESKSSLQESAEKDHRQDIQHLRAGKYKTATGQKSWWSHQVRWLAAAASIAFVTTVVYKLMPSKPSYVVPPPPAMPTFHLEWPSNPPFNSQQLTAWVIPRETMPTALPDFKRPGGTHDFVRKEDRRSENMATVLKDAENATVFGMTGNEDGRTADISATLSQKKREAIGTLEEDDQGLKDYSAVLKDAEKATASGLTRKENLGLEDLSVIHGLETRKPVGALRTEERFVRWQEATVIVRTEQGWGSGAIISHDGWILTTYQVVQLAAQRAALEGEAARVQVITGQRGDGGSLTAQPAIDGILYRADPIHDLALLKLVKLPAGRKALPYFDLAKDVKANEDCYVIGAQPNGRPWWLRAGNVSRIFSYPEGQKRASTDVVNRDLWRDRTAATLLATGIQTSLGDSGGPLLNVQGKLIGITSALPSNHKGGAVGWHIALKHVQTFLENLPSRPEGVPFDLWTMGNPQATLLTPLLLDADGNARIDTLQMPYSEVQRNHNGDTLSEPMALAVMINFAQQAASIGDYRHRVPAGLWGMGWQGEFRFDMVIGMRADGVVITGYTGLDGALDEIRIARGKAEKASLIWQKGNDGVWRATRPTNSVRLFDSVRIGDVHAQWVVSRLDRLMRIGGTTTENKKVGSNDLSRENNGTSKTE